LKVFGTDLGENLIFVEGAVPGSNGTFVLVNDAVKKAQDQLPVPTFVAQPAAEPVVEATAEETVNEAEQA